MSHPTFTGITLALWTIFTGLLLYKYLPALQDAWKKWKTRSQASRGEIWQVLFCLVPTCVVFFLVLNKRLTEGAPRLEAVYWFWGLAILLLCQALGAFQGFTDSGEKADAMDLVTVFIYGLVGAGAGGALLLAAFMLASGVQACLGGS